MYVCMCMYVCRGVGNNTTGSPKFPSAHSGRINMGVAVLPQIPTPSSVPSSQAATINEPPPAYKLNATPPSTHRKPSPPPPYSSPHNQRPHAPTPSVPPAVPPKTYTLPNPEVCCGSHLVSPSSLLSPPFSSPSLPLLTSLTSIPSSPPSLPSPLLPPG